MRQVGFQDAAAQLSGRASDFVDRSDDGRHQFVHVEWAAVGEVALRPGPDPFVGVEVGRVGGEVLDVQARVSPQELGERRAGVGGGIVQQYDDRTTEVAEQFAEKSTHFLLSDVVEEEQIVEAQVLSSGADRDPRDDGDFVPAPLPVALHRGATLGRPSSHHQGGQEEARFIGKN